MSGIGEKRGRRATGQLAPRELSSLMADIDTVWRREDSPIGDCGILHELALVAPREAVHVFRERLSQTDAIRLEDRLGPVGIACGVLHDNRGIPGGVYGMWRSTLPVLLVSEQVPANYNRATEIARGLGNIIYGANVELVDEFTEGLRGSFVEIEANPAATAPSQRQDFMRAMGVVARRR